MATVRVPRPPYIHAMAQIVDDDGTDRILSVDCNIQITCPEMSMSSTRTEVPEIVHLWRERDLIPGRDNTGWTSSARWYAINTSILIQSLRANVLEVNKQVWLADYSAGGGPTELLCNWYELFCQEGKKCGYLVNGSKSYLIVKPG